MTTSGVPTCLAIHDLSCVGRSSLTAIIPVLAVLGVQAIPLPTALYSNHLGFARYHVTALTDQYDIMDAWAANGVHIDAVYSGFLASPAQVALVRAAISRYGKAARYVVVDPVMADDGRLYTAYRQDMVTAMRGLLTAADVVLPNWTEACLLADIPYCERPSPRLVEEVAQALGGDRRLLLMTSVPVDAHTHANVLYDAKTGDYRHITYRYWDIRTSGTGDLLAATVTGMLLGGAPPDRALTVATEFVTAAVAALATQGLDPRYGVPFESELARLRKEL